MINVLPLHLSASIVLYKNDPSQVLAATESLLASRLNVSLSVVDNSPSDKLRARMSETKADYFFSGRNLGFGAAHNVAMRKYLPNSEYHLILNPDVHFDPDILVTLYNFMQDNPQVGAVMPRVLYPDGSEQILCKLLPTPLDLIARRFGGRIGRSIFQSRIDRYLLRGASMAAPSVVPSLSGCFLLVRTEILRSIGLFDERYFMYMEDVDLCRRIGGVSSTVFFPGVSIFHEYAKGSYTSWHLLRHHMQSAWRYFSKWGWFRDAPRDRLNQRTWDHSEAEFK